MTGYLLRRVPAALIVLFVASLLIFAMVRVIPGGPEAALAGGDASPAELAAIRHDLGLDQNLIVQYGHWIGGVLTGDFGQSYRVGGSVNDLVGYGLANTVVLTLAALVVALLFAVVFSLAATIVDNRYLTAVLTVVNAVAIAVPPFVVGTVVILVFAIHARVLPAGGTPPGGLTENVSFTLQYLMLPAITLGLPAGAMLARFLTEALRTELRSPYVMTARSLGISHRSIVLRHALRNALPSTLTALGITVGSLLGGAILVESIFGWPGLGLLTEEGIASRDYPLVQVLVLLSVTVFVTLQLLADVAHAWLDPRIRLGGRS